MLRLSNNKKKKKMNQPLRLVETDAVIHEEPPFEKPSAKPLRDLETVRHVAVYSQLDFHRAASVTESESGYDNQPIMPFFINREPIDLGGPHQAKDVSAAISSRFDETQTPHLIGLRQRIFAEAQAAGLYECEMEDLGVYGYSDLTA
tara:strand:+ start:792 stop:1232 length:441 start_codon:yes stop_codon:yes gene_type:complete